MKTRIRFSTIVVLFCVSSSAMATMGLELLPKGRPFRLTFADPREIRMALGFEGDSRITASIGNYFSLFAIEPMEGDPWRIYFGLEGGGFFTMRRADSRFPLETADGLIGLYLEGSRGPWQVQLRYTHVSAHLADGSRDTPIPYSRETLILRGGYAPSPDVQVYAGLHQLANTIPALPGLSLQAGGSWFLPWSLGNMAPFMATDLKWKRESDFNPTWSFQAGLALNNPPEAYRSFRFFYSYFTGADPRGQYFFRSYTAHSLGIEMQI